MWWLRNEFDGRDMEYIVRLIEHAYLNPAAPSVLGDTTDTER